MGPVYVAVLGAFTLTLLIVAVEIPARLKAGLRAALVTETLFYFVIFAIGNVVATTVVFYTMDVADLLGERAKEFQSFGAAILGVFGFEVIISNLNITYMGKGVLTLSDWIATARDGAISAAARRQVVLDNRQLETWARQLATRNEQELNAYLLNDAGKDPNDLNIEAGRMDLDRMLHKALFLVNALDARGKRDRIEAIIGEQK